MFANLFFDKEKEFLNCESLDKLLKNSTDYRAMPTAQAAQQTLRILAKKWKSYFEAKKDYKEHPEKYQEEPQIPGYKARGENGYFVLVLTNQNCKIENSFIKFPKTFSGFTLQTNISGKFQQVRMKYDGYRIKVEVVYKIEDEKIKNDNTVVVGCDLGVRAC